MNNSVSIEKFAAYLDENLSLEDTQDMAQLIMNDSSLSELLAVNTAIDNQMQQMVENGFILPDKLANLDFDYPQLDDVTIIVDVDEFEGLLADEDSNDVNNEGASLNHEAESLNVEHRNYITPDCDSIVASGMQTDFVNND